MKIIMLMFSFILMAFFSQLQAIEYDEKFSSLLEEGQKEAIYWEKNSTSPRLLSRVIEDVEGRAILAVSRFYNQEGLVEREAVFGNLSGTCDAPIIIGENGYPVPNGIECYGTTYSYEEDSQNLLLSEAEDNGLITFFQYDPFTKQCLAELRGNAEGLLMRCFHEYDANGFLIKIILDDGKSENAFDLTQVQKRQIFDIVRSDEEALLGLPLFIECRYWDPETQKEIFLESQYNTYSPEGRLVQQEHYDSTHTLVYRVNFIYDDQGNLIATTESPIDETNPQSLNSVEKIGKGMKSLMISCFDYLKLFAQYVNREIHAEFPLSTALKEPLEIMSQAIFGQYYHMMGNATEELAVESCGEKEINPKVRVTFINGVLTDSQSMAENLNFISQSHGGVKIHYVFRPTQGWMWDMSNAILIKFGYTFGFRSQYAHLLANLWRSLILEMGGTDGEGVIIHYAHSLGGSDTDRARDLLSPEEQKMIRIITMGSATFIRNEGFQDVKNHASVNDGVHFFDPIGHYRHLFDSDSNVYFHGLFSRTSWPLVDHKLCVETYRNLIHHLGEKFLFEFGQN